MTGITLSEPWKRMAKAPRPPLRTGLQKRASLVSTPPMRRGVTSLRFAHLGKPAEPGRRPHEGTTTGRVACRANHAWVGPVLPAKIFPFAITPNQPYRSAIPSH